jgi:general nucleoside transport system permease protein
LTKKILTGVMGIFIALLLGALLMLLQGYNPIETYGALFQFSLFRPGPFATTLKNSVPLILTGLSASIAFASGVVNLGQPGQLLMGALAATLGGIYLDLPAPLMIPVLLLLGMLGGALWAGIAAFLRLAFNMNEFIVTLMLNMIADYFTAWAIAFPFMDKGANSPMTPPVNSSGWIPEVGGVNLSVLIMLIAVAASWFLFNKWRAGYEWRITGQNSLFARLGGCDTNKNFTAVMLVTGALAGLAGCLIILAGPHRFLRGLGANYAWDGIMVAIVANNSIIATLFYGIFFAAIQTGALGMELVTNVPSEISQVLQAVLVLVIVASRGVLETVVDRWDARRRVKEPAT